MSRPRREFLQPDKIVVDGFLDHLALLGRRSANGLVKYPDERTRSRSAIDAVARGNNGCFAIEHTSLDLTPNTRKIAGFINNRFRRMEAELGPALSYPLSISVNPDHALKICQNVNLLERFKEWIVRDSGSLPPGYSHPEFVLDRTAIAFVSKGTKPPGKLSLGCLLEAKEIDIESFRSQLEKKSLKLKRYSERRFKTILLVEVNDFSVPDHALLLSILNEGLDRRSLTGVDEVWLAHNLGSLEYYEILPRS